MATNWVLSQALAATPTSTAGLSETITAPVTGSLLTCTTYFIVGTSAPTSFTISDNGLGGGWTAWGTLRTNGTLSVQRFYKLSDGTETSVTSTAVGYGGTITSHRMQVNNFTVTGGGTIALDLAVGAVSGSVSSISVSPASGSSQPSNTDEMALICFASGSGLTQTSASFTGTSSLASAALTLNANGGAIGEHWVGGVQASATNTTDVFKAAYGGGPGIVPYDCATFYYVPSVTSNYGSWGLL
jgi:hypothetical protein